MLRRLHKSGASAAGAVARVFLSYAAEDRDRVAPLVERLEAAGLSVWWDRRIGVGTSFDLVIEREIEAARCILVVWSAHSVGSEWVRNEAMEGLERGVLVPVQIDDVRPPLAFRRTHTARLIGWPGTSAAGAVDELVAEVERVAGPGDASHAEAAPAASSGAIGAAARPEPAARVQSRWVIAGLAALLLGASAVAIFLASRGSAPAVGTPGGAIDALAVLPFENVGGDPTTEFLSDGVAEQMINSLSQVRRDALKVRPFSSVARYKGTHPDVAGVARDLGVQVVITGALLKEGNALSIRVAMTHVQDQSHLWGQRYEGTLDGIVELQDQIARDVAANLRLRLTHEEERRLAQVHTRDPEAYTLYLEGMYHIQTFRPESMVNGRRLLERALEKDPNYAAALTGIGISYVRSGSLVTGTRIDYPRAMPYLRRALEIDDSIADAHAGLGTIHMILERDWVSAERELRRGFELGSTLPLWGFWLAAQGRLDEALAVFENNQALDPLAASRRNELAMVHNWRREWDEATHWAKRSLDVDAGFVLAHAELGLAYSSKGGHEEAIDALRRGLDLTGDDLRVRAMLGYAYGAAGREEEAREQLATIRERRSFGTAIARARVHAALGELDEAFLALRDAADERHPAVSWIRIDPSLDALRPDPRFDALVAEIGLTP